MEGLLFSWGFREKPSECGGWVLDRLRRDCERFDFCGRKAEFEVAETTLQNGHETPCAS